MRKQIIAVVVILFILCFVSSCLQFDKTKVTLKFDNKAGTSGKIKREYFNLSSSAAMPKDTNIDAKKLEAAKQKYEKELDTDYKDLLDRWKESKFIEETYKNEGIQIEKRDVSLKGEEIDGYYEGKFEQVALDRMNFMFVDNYRCCILPKSAGSIEKTDAKIISTGSYYLLLWDKDKKEIFFVQSPMKTGSNYNLLTRWKQGH